MADDHIIFAFDKEMVCSEGAALEYIPSAKHVSPLHGHSEAVRIGKAWAGDAALAEQISLCLGSLPLNAPTVTLELVFQLADAPCTYTYTYVHIHVQMCIYLYILEYIYTSIYIYVYTHTLYIYDCIYTYI